MGRLLRHFQEGGWGMYPVLLALGAVLCIGVWRAVRVRRLSLGVTGVVDGVLLVLRESGSVGAAIDVCVDTQSPFSLVVGRALAEAHRPFWEVRAALANERRRFFGVLSDARPVLPVLAGIVTLLGLFGTVTGYVPAFCTVGNADAASKATMLAKETSEALNCTAFALLASLLCILLHAWTTTSSERLLSLVDAELARLTTALEPGAPYTVHGIHGESPRDGYRGRGFALPPS